MMDVSKLISIAEDLNLQDKANALRFYAERLASNDKDLIMPLVGEFSSGKTTLINSLLDNPNLETASRATTASIFEIHFGADSCHAEIISGNGNVESVDDVVKIENSKLEDVELVKVYDTSNKVGSSTILVDTPGLSSNDPAHRIALSSYLPNADAILLLTDVNQQLTRSLIDFLNSSKLANKPVYAVITKSDTKTENELLSAKKYIQDNIDFSFADIITVSATTGDMGQFYELMDKIQAQKNDIVEKAIHERVKGIAAEMSEVVTNLLNVKESTEDLDQSIDLEKRKLEKLNRNINDFMSEVNALSESASNSAVTLFTENIFVQIDNIIKTQGRDCDAAVNAAVNGTGMMIIQNFQKDLLSSILSAARSRQSGENEVPVGALEAINLTDNAFNGFTYNIDLSSVGHKYDKAIGIGLLVTAASVLTAGAASVAGVAGAGTAAGAAATVGTVAKGAGATIASDIATDAVLYSKMNRMQKAARITSNAGKIAGEVVANASDLNSKDQELARRSGLRKGFLETSVGWVTEFFAKSQRQKAVNNYIDYTLIPEFLSYVKGLSSTMCNEISSILHQEALNSSSSIMANLESLKSLLSQKKEDYEKRRNTYFEYKRILNEL